MYKTVQNFSVSIENCEFRGNLFNQSLIDMQAVVKRLMTDVPFGVLLSGGLDSSLVAAVASRHLAGTRAANIWGKQLHSFCVGLQVNYCS